MRGSVKAKNCRLWTASVAEVVRLRDHDRALPEEQPALEQQRALVVQQVTPPVLDHELRDDDRDRVVVVAGVDLVDVAQDGPRELAVRGLDDLEGHIDTPLFPLALD